MMIALWTIIALLVHVSLSSVPQQAYVSWDPASDKFTVHKDPVENFVAHATFTDEIFLTGWSYLDVRTDEKFPDSVQAYSAGLAEGFLTADLLKKHWNNLIDPYCIGEEPYCRRLRSFLEANADYMNFAIARRRKQDPYWHQVALVLEQVSGLEDGYKNVSGTPRTKPDVTGVMFMNILGDLLDLEKVLNRSVSSRPFGSGSCSALVKLLPDNEDLYSAHDTWSPYNTMLRILKKYNISVHVGMRKGLDYIVYLVMFLRKAKASFEAWFMNTFGEASMDLEEVLNRSVSSHPVGSGSCSALVKLLPDNEDLYFAHNTWLPYNTMLRILKKYNISVHSGMQEGSPIIPGQSTTFSSQPGLLGSGDDFYLISSGLATMETTIGNFNSSLWKYVQAKGTVLEWLRSIVANRLARNGREWSRLFANQNSGTYNNEWMIVDYNKFLPGAPLQDDLLWVLEQLPGYIHTADVTDVLRKQGYWPSYNAPYFKGIFSLSGRQENVEKYGDWFTYDKTPRALIFKRDQSTVLDIKSMTKIMRYNDYVNDPLSRCNCTPPYSATNAIASRCDLNPANGTYPFAILGHDALGATDMKLTSSSLFKKLEFVAFGGPTYDPLPPFKWSDTDFGNTVPHEGHPDLWNFKPIVHKWLQ